MRLVVKNKEEGQNYSKEGTTDQLLRDITKHYHIQVLLYSCEKLQTLTDPDIYDIDWNSLNFGSID